MLQRLLSFWKVLLSPRRNSRILSEWRLGCWSPPCPGPFSQKLTSLARWPALGRFLVVPSFFYLRMMLCVLGTFNAAVFKYPSQDHNPVSELYGQFLWPLGLVFALTCTVNCGSLYRQVCAFPNHVQSITFTTGGLKSSCRNISRMINGNRMHLSSTSSLIAKNRNTYVNKVFFFGSEYICKHF